MPKPWKTLSTREVYRNPWIHVREDLAELPNGRTTLYGKWIISRGDDDYRHSPGGAENEPRVTFR